MTRPHRLSWESWAAIVWAGGSLHSLATILAANVRLTWLARDAPPAAGNAHTDLMRDLTRKAGIGGTVRLLYSDRCRMPFAWNILNPSVSLHTHPAAPAILQSEWLARHRRKRLYRSSPVIRLYPMTPPAERCVLEAEYDDHRHRTTILGGWGILNTLDNCILPSSLSYHFRKIFCHENWDST